MSTVEQANRNIRRLSLFRLAAGKAQVEGRISFVTRTHWEKRCCYRIGEELSKITERIPDREQV